MAAKYILARSAGFCFGVERSIRMAEEALASGACRCLGELIHNRDAVTALEKKGLSVIEKVSELPEGGTGHYPCPRRFPRGIYRAEKPPRRSD